MMQGRKFLPCLTLSIYTLLFKAIFRETHLGCEGNKSTSENFSYDDCKLKVHSSFLIHQTSSLGLSPAPAAHTGWN